MKIQAIVVLLTLLVTLNLVSESSCWTGPVPPGRKRQMQGKVYILFAGREVRIEKNCARGLEYGLRPQAEGRAQDRGHSFSQYGPTKAGK